MKITVVVLVYNRYDNLRHWLNCWKKVNKGNYELIVIHNVDTALDTFDFRDLCNANKVKYIPRQNIGYDIGAFQDVCYNRLDGFPEWERILWITDDTFPMSYDFVGVFNAKMHPTVGVVCMQISLSYKRHIRTTGFMIDKSVAIKLRFPKNPILTKEDCYQFEHRHPKITFYQQIVRLGLKVIQVAPNAISPLWDSGYHKRVRRGIEHKILFGEYKAVEPKNIDLSKHNEQVHSVTFICTIYNGYPQIISSLLQQTNPNWILWLIHDGPGNVIDVPNDPRIKLIYTPQRIGNYGHSYRAEYLQQVTTEYVVITNNDNYHVPVYIEYMMQGFSNGTVGVYCSDMVHSYKAWQVIPCSLRLGYIDCASMMLKSEAAKRVGWKDITSHSADWTFFSDLIANYGDDKFVKVKGCLLIHN